MIHKLRAILSRTRLMLKTIAILSIASLLLTAVFVFIYPAAESGRNVPDASVTITETTKATSSTVTVDVIWDAGETVESVVVEQYESDKSVTIDEIGQKASISGLAEGDKLKIISHQRSGRKTLIQLYTI